MCGGGGQWEVLGACVCVGGGSGGEGGGVKCCVYV